LPVFFATILGAWLGARVLKFAFPRAPARAIATVVITLLTLSVIGEAVRFFAVGAPNWYALGSSLVLIPATWGFLVGAWEDLPGRTAPKVSG
jgi:hypothetical protein